MFNKTTNIDLKLDKEIIIDFLNSLKGLLVVYLSGKESEIKKARMEFIKPLLQQEWDKTNSQEAEKINKALESKGEKIRKAREQYKEDLLNAQKTKKDTSLILAKLEVLDKLMEGYNV